MGINHWVEQEQGSAEGPKKLEDTLTDTRINALLVALPLAVATLLGGTAGLSAPSAETTTEVLVQAADAATASRLVGVRDGTVTDELGLIRAVGSRLSAAQRDRLAGLQGVLHLSTTTPCCPAPSSIPGNLAARTRLPTRAARV